MLRAAASTFDAPGNLPLDESKEHDYRKTIPENYLIHIEKFAKDKFLGYRAGLSTTTQELMDEYSFITYEESAKYVQRIVEQLLSLGIKPKDTVCIYAKNSPLWLLADIAISFCGGISVPIYDTLGVDNIQYCMDYVKTRFVFVGSDVLGNILGMTNSIASLEHIIMLDKFASPADTSILAQKVFLKLDGSDIQLEDDTKSLFQLSVHSKQSIEEANTEDMHVPEVDQFVLTLFKDKTVNRLNLHLIDTDISKSTNPLQLPPNQNPNAPSAIIFTSGTSGRPKAVVSSSTNTFASGCIMGHKLQPYNKTDAGTQPSTLSYLPLAHVYERCFEHFSYCRGYLIYYFSGDTRNLAQDISLAKPTMLPGVPRVYSKIYYGVQKKISAAGGLAKSIFSTATYLKRAYLRAFPSAYRTGRAPVLDKIFTKIRENLGGNLEIIISGSASLPVKVMEFLQVNTCARLMHGYGLTETSATGLVICSGEPVLHKNQLGKCSWETEVGLVDRSDVSEFSLDKDRVGEILIKGPGVCLGYYEGDLENLTGLVDKEGFYHTGDLGRLHEDGSIAFVRRISLIQKLQHGEFVDLEQLESAIEASPVISACFCYADPSKTAPVCIICIDSNAVKNSSEMSLEAQMLQEIEKLVRKAGIKAFCIPRAVKVYQDVDWTVDRFLFTPSAKKQHQNFRKHFAQEIDVLLEQIE